MAFDDPKRMLHFCTDAGFLVPILGKDAIVAINMHTYKRHRPEQTLLYQLVEQYYPDFLEYLSHQGKTLPHHVDKEFAEFLKCGRYEHGFLRVLNCLLTFLFNYQLGDIFYVFMLEKIQSLKYLSKGNQTDIR